MTLQQALDTLQKTIPKHLRFRLDRDQSIFSDGSRQLRFFVWVECEDAPACVYQHTCLKSLIDAVVSVYETDEQALIDFGRQILEDSRK